jgi:hypothetical protein
MCYDNDIVPILNLLYGGGTDGSDTLVHRIFYRPFSVFYVSWEVLDGCLVACIFYGAFEESPVVCDVPHPWDDEDVWF